ncbi:MAG: hypothetical protein ACREBW_08035 [Candidatus Micrarchaeaceae archaeon]
MTRVLSELLGAAEPMFHRGLARLETASGHASTDIRLSTDIERAARAKLRELGLDPRDTTGTELYAALGERVKADDARLTAVLRKKYGDISAHASIGKILAELPLDRSCFSLKAAVGKRLLKSHQPKHTMKALGYRSFDSMMRRESLQSVYAAAWLLEPRSWQKTMLESYKKLHASDFEIRQLSVVAPESERWQGLASVVVAQKKHNIVGLKELGSIVLLPLPSQQPPAATLAMLVLGLHEINQVRAASTFLKLSQVRPNFGQCVHTVVASEPIIGTELLQSQLSWQVVQRYFARFADRFRAELFEPHVQKEDLSWHSVEKALGYIEPGMAFWHHTANLGILHDHQPVSFNVADAVLNFCNQLPYEQRMVHYLRRSLWHELIMRYLKHENVEQMVLASLESQLVEEPALL